jgi:hypothetical protein
MQESKFVKLKTQEEYRSRIVQFFQQGGREFFFDFMTKESKKHFSGKEKTTIRNYLFDYISAFESDEEERKRMLAKLITLRSSEELRDFVRDDMMDNGLDP